MATQTTHTTQTTNTAAARVTTSRSSRLETLGILLIIGGQGYINGNFIQPIDTGFGKFIDLVHFIPLALMLWIGMSLLRPSDEATSDSGSVAHRHRGLRVGVTILAVLGVITCLVMIALGIFAPSLGIGVQEFADWLAVILLMGGAVFWFIGLFAARASTRATAFAATPVAASQE